ncbi:hypothetical protein MTBPR1_70123 [Candidatus Terasakiella magnetica]|uniref:Uncharacterized protein n=1 Tax=Candidatus Terasakiella magnetica TaxID=1867952 RepID=A0A1C3RKU5_9PROT|nr:hypothetical protein [Candidatus Terasakiella magnetica]SCA57851.1 hypothetical protein MTBPR1_70123 [Candidatus Terasakiella magnetica]
MQIVFPDSIEGIPAFYQSCQGDEEKIKFIVKGLIEHDLLDYAESFTRLACSEFHTSFWPFINLLCILTKAGKKVESISVAANIMKTSRMSGDVMCDQVVFEIYSIMRDFMQANQKDVVQALMELAARLRPYGKRLISSSGELAPLSQDEFKAKITKAIEEFKQGKTALPFVLDHFNKCELKDISAFKGKKVLGVFRQRAYSSKEARDVEFLEFYPKTALPLGLDYRTFYHDAFVHTKHYSAEDYIEQIDRLEKEVREWRPDYIYIDNLLSHHEPEITERVQARLAAWKAEYGFKVIGFFADAWGNKQKKAIGQTMELADAFHHSHSTYIGTLPEDVEKKTLCFPCPYPRSIFDCPDVEKDIFTLFHGTLNPMRVPWATKILESDLNVKMHFSNHHVKGEVATMDAYARALSRAKVSLILTARTTMQTAMTGTVWEAILTNSMILEEESVEAPHYLVPFVHYVPFCSYAQLKHYIKYLEQDEELVSLIRQNASDFYDQYYSPDHFWSGILSLADANH